MRHLRLASIVLASLVTTAAADAPPPAPPAPAPQIPAEVQVDITDSSAPTAPSFTGALALLTGECGSVEASAPTGHYEIRMCLENRGGPVTLLQVDVDRVIHGRADLHQKVKTTTRVDPGKRVVRGRFGAGADTTEIAASIK